MDNKKLSAVIYSLLAIGALGACSHQQTVPEAAAKPPPQFSELKPMADASSDHSNEEDLDALLRATVLHFDFDQSSLSSDSQARLQKLANALQDHRNRHIKIAGHCDDRGTEEYNLVLGSRRAAVAQKYLANLGIASNRIETISYGKERPVDTRHNEEAWAANRRDEFSGR